MAQSTDVVADSTDLSLGPNTCNVCGCDFSLDEEGGADGFIGVIPVTFCPTCHAGLHDMYTAWYGKDENNEVILIPDKD